MTAEFPSTRVAHSRRRATRRNVAELRRVHRRRRDRRLLFEHLEDRTLLSVDLDLAWARTFGSGGDEWPPSIARDAIGNIYVAGTKGAGGWYGTFYVCKYGAAGQVLQWERTFDQGNGAALAIDAGNNVYVVGPRVVSGVEGQFAASLDPNGNERWRNQLTSTGPNQAAYDVALDSSGAVYVGGAYSNLWKLNGTNGQQVWHASVGRGVLTVAINSQDEIYVAGDVEGENTFLAKYDSNGTQGWYKTWGNGDIRIASIAIDADGNVVAVTNFSGNATLDPRGSVLISSNNGSADVAVSKFRPDGTFLWGSQANVIGGPDVDFAGSIAVDPGGNIFVLANSRTAVGPEDFDGLLTVFPPTGDTVIWSGTFGTPAGTRSDTRANGITIDSQSNVYIGGNFNNTTDLDPNATTFSVGPANGRDAFLLKLEPGGAPVNHPPIANAGSDQSVTEGQTAQFDGRGSFDPDNDPLTYAWDFGDGSTATGATPSHVYTDNGSYTVVLTVDGESGGEGRRRRGVEGALLRCQERLLRHRRGCARRDQHAE